MPNRLPFFVTRDTAIMWYFGIKRAQMLLIPEEKRTNIALQCAARMKMRVLGPPMPTPPGKPSIEEWVPGASRR
jgi:hypothetical protein